MLGAPNSIWPPHVLFGPFLLLITFGAGVASGDVKFLPIVILAGGMLVHGHVAQPLFVVPLGCLALIRVVRRGEYRNAHLAISALILAVFVLPIGIDSLRGSQSNIAAILQHISFLYTTRVQKYEPELSIDVCGDSGPILPHPSSLPGSRNPCHITVTLAPTGSQPDLLK